MWGVATGFRTLYIPLRPDPSRHPILVRQEEFCEWHRLLAFVTRLIATELIHTAWGSMEVGGN